MISKSISLTFTFAILWAFLIFFPVPHIITAMAETAPPNCINYDPVTKGCIDDVPKREISGGSQIGKLSNGTDSGIKPTEIKSWLDRLLDSLKAGIGAFVDFSKRSGGKLINPILNLFKTSPADQRLEKQKQELEAIKKEIKELGTLSKDKKRVTVENILDYPEILKKIKAYDEKWHTDKAMGATEEELVNLFENDSNKGIGTAVATEKPADNAVEKPEPLLSGPAGAIFEDEDVSLSDSVTADGGDCAPGTGPGTAKLCKIPEVGSVKESQTSAVSFFNRLLSKKDRITTNYEIIVDAAISKATFIAGALSEAEGNPTARKEVEAKIKKIIKLRRVEVTLDGSRPSEGVVPVYCFAYDCGSACTAVLKSGVKINLSGQCLQAGFTFPGSGLNFIIRVTGVTSDKKYIIGAAAHASGYPNINLKYPKQIDDTAGALSGKIGVPPFGTAQFNIGKPDEIDIDTLLKSL